MWQFTSRPILLPCATIMAVSHGMTLTVSLTINLLRSNLFCETETIFDMVWYGNRGLSTLFGSYHILNVISYCYARIAITIDNSHKSRGLHMFEFENWKAIQIKNTFLNCLHIYVPNQFFLIYHRKKLCIHMKCYYRYTYLVVQILNTSDVVTKESLYSEQLIHSCYSPTAKM